MTTTEVSSFAVSTLLGYYPDGIAVNPADGNLYVAASGSILSVDVTTDPYTATVLAGNYGWGFSEGAGDAATFNSPAGLAVDPTTGDVVVSDSRNNLIRKITPNDGDVTVVAGQLPYGSADSAQGTTASFYMPTGVAVDSAGNVIVADEVNHVLRKISPAGAVTTLAGTKGVQGDDDGPASSALFSYPRDVAFDRSGNLYVSVSSGLRKITPSGTVSTVGQSGWGGFADGPVSSALFSGGGLCADVAGNVFMADTYNQRIRKIWLNGTVSTLAGNGTASYADGPGSQASFTYPSGCAVDTASNVYVTDTFNGVIRKITPAGNVSTFAGGGDYSNCWGNADGQGTNACFWYPSGIAIDASNNVYVTTAMNSVRKISPGGLVSTYAGPNTLAVDGGPALFSPQGLAVGSSNTVIIADTGNNLIRALGTPPSLGSSQISYTAYARPWLSSTLPLFVDPQGSYTSEVLITAFDAVDVLSPVGWPSSTPFTTFQASFVNLTQLFGYGFSPNGANVTLQLNAFYADGTSALLWSANTSTLYGVSLPQRAIALNSALSVTALQFTSAASAPALFYVDPYMSQLIFASGSRSDSDGLPENLDNFDLVTAKRNAVRARGASSDASGLPAAVAAAAVKRTQRIQSAKAAIMRQQQTIARRAAVRAEPGTPEAAAASAPSRYLQNPSSSTSSSTSSSSSSSSSTTTTSSEYTFQANATRTPRRTLPSARNVQRRRPRSQFRPPVGSLG